MHRPLHFSAAVRADHILSLFQSDNWKLLCIRIFNLYNFCLVFLYLYGRFYIKQKAEIFPTVRTVWVIPADLYSFSAYRTHLFLHASLIDFSFAAAEAADTGSFFYFSTAFSTIHMIHRLPDRAESRKNPAICSAFIFLFPFENIQLYRRSYE